jgi:hypothetical protein
MIHHQALAPKTLPAPLGKGLDQTIQIANSVKGGALNSRLFKQLCTDMDAGHHLLTFHTKVQQLSRLTWTSIFFQRCEDQNNKTLVMASG